jgi:hypothetical protein
VAEFHFEGIAEDVVAVVERGIAPKKGVGFGKALKLLFAEDS